MEELAILAVRALDALLDYQDTRSRPPNVERWVVVRWVLVCQLRLLPGEAR